MNTPRPLAILLITQLFAAGLAQQPAPIQIIVTDMLADKKHRVATQWMDFQIVK